MALERRLVVLDLALAGPRGRRASGARALAARSAPDDLGHRPCPRPPRSLVPSSIRPAPAAIRQRSERSNSAGRDLRERCAKPRAGRRAAARPGTALLGLRHGRRLPGVRRVHGYCESGDRRGSDRRADRSRSGCDRASRGRPQPGPETRRRARRGARCSSSPAPGSGKTRVLTRRIAYLLATGQARPSEILAITFTNKAAEEMRNRVSELVGGVSRLMWVMTFHSACARILRANAERLGYKKAVHDLRRVRFAAHGQALHGGARRRQQALPAARDPERDLRREEPARGLDRLRRPRGRATSRTPSPRSTTLYERRMLEASAMDFDDLLVRTVNLLELFADVRERYQRTFRWVLVDEYQDTNRAQYRLLQLLSEEHGNLTVVGDEDQSVYSFRAADVRNILDFDKDFPSAEVVKLEQNYRSTQKILDAANAVVANNRDRREKQPVHRRGRGRARPRLRARRRACRGPLRRRRDRAAGRRRGLSRARRSRSSTG